MSEAQTIHDNNNGSIVLLHVDEIQVFLPQTPPRYVGSLTKIRDYVLAAFSDVINSSIVVVESKSWLRVIFTGTNFFSPLAIKLGSALKLWSINITGSFHVQLVCEKLLDAEFPGLVKSFADNSEWFGNQIGFVSGNRRCVQYLILEI